MMITVMTFLLSPNTNTHTHSHTHTHTNTYEHTLCFIVFSQKTSIPELFAVMRQWVPQTQKNMTSLTREVHTYIQLIHPISL